MSILLYALYSNQWCTIWFLLKVRNWHPNTKENPSNRMGFLWAFLIRLPPAPSWSIFICIPTERCEVGSRRRKKSLNGCFFESKARSKEFRKWASERAKRLCACRVDLDNILDSVNILKSTWQSTRSRHIAESRSRIISNTIPRTNCFFVFWICLKNNYIGKN